MLCTAFTLGLALSPVRSQPRVSAVEIDQDFHGEVQVRLEPHGEQVCASGCGLSRHPTPFLERSHFEKLVKDFAHQPMSEESPALEELLYFGPQTQRELLASDATPLDSQRLAFLKKELTRDTVQIEFRIIDEEGIARVQLPPTTVKLDSRYAFEPLNTVDFQPPEASGTVKRVGLNHLWQRI